MKENKTLYVVIPCYREQEVLLETARVLKAKMLNLIDQKKISPNSRVMFVNDGSSDRTWEIICELHEQDRLFSGVNLSRNRGHQNALLAGLMTAVQFADMTISMDADLQDDINAMDGMIDAYHNGCDIVYGVRSSRKKDTFFKRFTAEGFYHVVKMMGVEIIVNHADFRLMSKRAVEGLAAFKEVNLFLRGIVPQIGYKSTIVEYERGERFAGESKYPLKKMLALAFDGITSFSIQPLRFLLWIGALISIIGAVLLLCAAFGGLNVLLGSVWFVGGLQLTGMGILGEYIGKTYGETKARPRYIIENVLNEEN